MHSCLPVIGDRIYLCTQAPSKVGMSSGHEKLALFLVPLYHPGRILMTLRIGLRNVPVGAASGDTVGTAINPA